MYVHIIDSLFQLIYILWVFYVRMLSICHKFIDPSISGGLIPHICFGCLQVNNIKRVTPKGTKAHWVNPYKFILSVWKAIISRGLDQGTIIPIGLIPIIVFTGCKEIKSRESSQGALSPIELIPINLF